MSAKSFNVSAVVTVLCIGAIVGYLCSQAAGTGELMLDGRKARAEGVQATKAAKSKVQRFGQVIGLKKDKQLVYDMLHAHPWAPVNKMIKQSNIRNYSIYEVELDGKLYLFAYFEYTGDNVKADIAKMAKDKATQEWWKLTDPCQQRLPGTPQGDQWLGITEVYHLD